MRPSLAFSLACAAYVFFAAGYVDTIDAVPSLETARAVVSEGTLAVTPKHSYGMLYRLGRNQRWYSKMGLAYPVLYLPAAALGNLAPANFASRVSEFGAALVNPLLTAAIVALLCLFFLDQGVDARRAGWLCAMAGFATLLFPYSKTTHREPLQALCLLGVFVMATRQSWLAAGVFAACGMLTKLALLAPLVPAIAYAGSLAPPSERRRAWSRLFLPLVAGAVIWMIFATYVWEDPLATGYSPTVSRLRGPSWRAPLTRGIVEMWLSPYRGLLFFCPTVVLMLAALRRERLSAAIGACVIVQTILYAKWTDQGRYVLGPRCLIVILPILMLAWKNLRWRAWMAPVVALSLAIQVSSSFVKAQQYTTMHGRTCSPLRDPHWLANFKITGHKLTGAPEVYRPETFGGRSCGEIDLRDARSLDGLNFWWLHVFKTASR